MSLKPAKFLTPDEVAKRLRVSTDTIIRLCKSGEIVGTKVGRQWRIREDAVEQFENRGGMVADESEWGDVPDYVGGAK